MESAPQVRVRRAGDRAQDQIGELAALNERLAGHEAHKIRQRVEHLKRKRSAWKSVYESACRTDTALTLETLERSISEVRVAPQLQTVAVPDHWLRPLYSCHDAMASASGRCAAQVGEPCPKHALPRRFPSASCSPHATSACMWCLAQSTCRVFWQITVAYTASVALKANHSLADLRHSISRI